MAVNPFDDDGGHFFDPTNSEGPVVARDGRGRTAAP